MGSVKLTGLISVPPTILFPGRSNPHLQPVTVVVGSLVVAVVVASFVLMVGSLVVVAFSVVVVGIGFLDEVVVFSVVVAFGPLGQNLAPLIVESIHSRTSEILQNPEGRF